MVPNKIHPKNIVTVGKKLQDANKVVIMIHMPQRIF